MSGPVIPKRRQAPTDVEDSENPRVLVADDSQELACRMRDLLDAEGFSVLGPAFDGTAALRMYQEARPDAIVLDVSMPGMSGIDVTERVRQVDRRCAIVILTSHAEPSIREGCLAAGADRVLFKQDVDQLVDVVKQVLDGRV